MSSDSAAELHSCPRCGYSTAAASSFCPECGLAQRDSPTKRWLRYADPSWIKELALGMNLTAWSLRSILLASLLIMLTGMLAAVLQQSGASSSILQIFEVAMWLAAIVLIASPIALSIGLWLGSAPDPYTSTSWAYFIYRIIALAIVPLWALWIVTNRWPQASSLIIAYSGAALMWLHLIMLPKHVEMIRQRAADAHQMSRALLVAVHVGIMLVWVLELASTPKGEIIRLIWFIWFAVLYSVMRQMRTWVNEERALAKQVAASPPDVQ